jgi:mannose-6-phosphate isomerase-like protein (cupin superfamily)
MPVLANATREAFMMSRGEGRRIHVVGDEATIKISTPDTDGAFAVFEGITQPLQGPPLHRHLDQDEWWYILDGEFKFEVDGREIFASAGATVFAPRGSAHTFQNVGAAAGRMLTTVVPGGLDIFFAELETVAPRGSVPDPAKMVPVFVRHNLELLGPPLGARSAASASL